MTHTDSPEAAADHQPGKPHTHELQADGVSAAGSIVMAVAGSAPAYSIAATTAILVSAAASSFPEALVGQLKDGGRMVLPLESDGAQRLVQATREGDNLLVREIMPVTFTRLETVF